MEGAREAVAHQILVTRDGSYSFRHALVGEAIYEDLLPGERTALHAALGRALEADPDAAAAELACHWQGAHDLPRALARVGGGRRRGTAPVRTRRGAGHFERALALWDRVPDAAERAGMSRSDVLRAAAAAAHDGFESSRSIALQREALGAAAGAEPVELARMHAELARYLRHANEHDASDAEIRLAIEAAARRCRARAGAGARPELEEPDAARAVPGGGRGGCDAAADARRLGALDLEAGAVNTEGIARGALGDADEGARLLRRARDIAVEIGSPAELLRAVCNLPSCWTSPAGPRRRWPRCGRRCR